MPFPPIGAPPGRISRVGMRRAFFPAFWSRSSASKAVPIIRPVDAVSFKVAWMRRRRVWSCLCDRPHSRARRAHGLALDHPTQQQHKARGALPGFREDGPGQHGVVTIADPTAVCWKVALCTEQMLCTVPTARACPPMAVEMTFQPESANALVHELGNREINHAVMITHPARWLYMSQKFYDLRRDQRGEGEIKQRGEKALGGFHTMCLRAGG